MIHVVSTHAACAEKNRNKIKRGFNFGKLRSETPLEDRKHHRDLSRFLSFRTCHVCAVLKPVLQLKSRRPTLNLCSNKEEANASAGLMVIAIQLCWRVRRELQAKRRPDLYEHWSKAVLPRFVGLRLEVSMQAW